MDEVVLNQVRSLETILKGSDESGLLLASPLMDGSKWVTILGLSMISAILAQYTGRT